MERTNDVLMVLIIHATPGIDEDIDAADKDWKQVSSIVDIDQFLYLTTVIRRAVAIVCGR